jgi:uncharacterized membrane protein YczE
VKANAPLKWTICTPLLVIVALPLMNYAALKFGEAGMDVLKYAVIKLRDLTCGANFCSQKCTGH